MVLVNVGTILQIVDDSDVRDIPKLISLSITKISCKLKYSTKTYYDLTVGISLFNSSAIGYI